jgi:hypothetical protein
LNRQQIILLGLLALLVLAVVVLALRNPQPPLLPTDETHRGFAGADACLECHGGDGPAPRSRNHPIGNDCLRCHGRP